MTKNNDNFPTAVPGGAIVALVTPFSDDGRSLDLAAFKALVDWHVHCGTAAVVVAGTTGESAALTDAERDSLLEAALAAADRRIPVIAGTGAPVTEKAVAQSRRAAGLGADAVLVVTPYYNRPPQRGLVEHYLRVADACPAPVVVYNVPKRTATDLAPDTMLKLAGHPNIAAVKEAVVDMARVRRYAEAGVMVLSGDDGSALEAMRNGASGVISVAANVAPEALAALCRAARHEDWEQALKIDGTLEPLYRFLGVESNPIPVKWLLAQAGRAGPAIRSPLMPLMAELHDQGRAVLSGLEQPGRPQSGTELA